MAEYPVIVNLLIRVLFLALIGTPGCNPARPGEQATPPAAEPKKQHPAGEIIPVARMRDAYPVRLGVVALMGVGDSSTLFEPSADIGPKLGPLGERWIAEHCDVAAFDSRCLTPDNYLRIRATQKLFTGLLFTYASSLYELPDHRGSVGVWRPEMASWELKSGSGAPVKHEDAGGHWMDCGNLEWQKYWGTQAKELASTFHADGVIAADMPPGNTFVGNDLLKYHRFSDKVDATSAFLGAVHKPSEFLLVPSAVGFDNLVGRPTLPVEHRRYEPRLTGRCWDEFDKLDDGAWAEGWVQLPWDTGKLKENDWEIQLEAADRASRFGEIYICGLGYSSAEELEYGLASFLLIVHHQGRAVVQPMPKLPGEPVNAGMSLKVMMREYSKYRSYFDVLLGGALRERMYVNLGNGSVWRRTFSNGEVYVNSSDSRSVSIQLGAPMLTVTGETVNMFSLGPHTGIILTKSPRNPLDDSK
jgi:hypothetical protein